MGCRLGADVGGTITRLCDHRTSRLQLGALME